MKNEKEVLSLVKKALRWTREANTQDTLTTAVALMEGTGKAPAKKAARKSTRTTKRK